jgi:hypothetical protein
MAITLTANEEIASLLFSPEPLVLSHRILRKDAGLLFFILAICFDWLCNDLTAVVDTELKLTLVMVGGRIASCVRRRVSVEMALMVIVVNYDE